MNSCDFYVKRISSLKTNTAENILSIGLVMKEAKTNLSKDDFQIFLQRTHYAEKSASVRKWICIGNAYLRLNAIADNLPPNWSTLYKLSSLSADKFDLLERKKVLSPTVTAREIDDALNKKSSSKLKPVKLVLTFASDVRPDVLKQIYDLIEKTLPTSVCTMNLTDEAEELLSTAMSNTSLLKLAA